MKVILFGATGMIGAGVLMACLADSRVESVLVFSRSSCGVVHPKLDERIRADFFAYTDVEDELRDVDACFFCLGASAAGLSEAEYHRTTYELTLSTAGFLVRGNPDVAFCYVSGAGTDSSEHGRFMWARVKGKTENALLRDLRNAYMFRPGYIQPVGGARSKTRWYQAVYDVFGPLYPLLRRIAPNRVTTTSILGRAMIEVAISGYTTRVLETPDINRVAGT